MSQQVVLGVGGGIAAYKSCELLRRLQDHGFDVTVIPTPSSLNFVGKATWEALSGKKINTSVFEDIENVNHISIGDNADFILIAPATADLIARIAAGRADDLLTNTILASNAKKMLVPAMHPKMWQNPATVANVNLLRSRGFAVMEPATGRLTGKDSGIGRFPETTEIINYYFANLANDLDLIGKKILITAGGTREKIDDVRFIGNHSSGKQGIAIAKEAKRRGAEVILIGANIAPVEGVRNIQVSTAIEMQSAVSNEFENSDVLIMAAAVADARPVVEVSGKIKKADLADIKLITNPDILAEISVKKKDQIIVGFAAEEKDLLIEGRRKLVAKNVDILYVNDISGGQIFGSDLTSGFLLTQSNSEQDELEVNRVSKDELARHLLDLVVSKLN